MSSLDMDTVKYTVQQSDDPPRNTRRKGQVTTMEVKLVIHITVCERHHEGVELEPLPGPAVHRNDGVKSKVFQLTPTI